MIGLYFFVTLDATNSSHQPESEQAEKKTRSEVSQVCIDDVITREKCCALLVLTARHISVRLRAFCSLRECLTFEVFSDR